MKFKVELKFDSNLDESEILNLCDETDELFEDEDLKCVRAGLGECIYMDKGRKDDFGRIWAALFALKDSPKLADKIVEGYWYEGNRKENLYTDFILD